MNFGETGSDPVICGVEALNGLGFNAHQTWALRRADLRALWETPFRTWRGEQISMGHIRVLPPDDFGAARIETVFTDLWKNWSRWLSGRIRPGRLAAALSLPERYAPQTRHPRFPGERATLEAFLRRRITAVDPEPRCELHPYGHGGGAYSVQWAAQQLTNGAVDVALVFGIDTYYDPDVVEWLLEQNQIYVGDGIDGFVPGEGGALVVLSTSDYARQQGWPVLARVSATNLVSEPQCSTVAPNLGVGLTSAVGGICESLEATDERVDWWLGDVSTEAYRIREFQLALPRFTARVAHADSVLEFVPTHFGDLGAATIPTAMTIAVEGFSRGAPRARNCLIWASSDGATRGAVLLRQLRRGSHA